jgi:glycosyltransferase involved in cell wall biosynthesis
VVRRQSVEKRRDVLDAARRQVIDRNDLAPIGDESLDEMRSDKTSGVGNKKPHLYAEQVLRAVLESSDWSPRHARPKNAAHCDAVGFSVMGKRLLFVVTEDWYFASHRLHLARAAVARGWSVYVATRVRAHAKEIAASGAVVVPIGLRREGHNPLHEASTIAELTRVYGKLRPDVAHHVAMKPVLYGSIAARLTNTPFVVNAFAGMGYAFSGTSTARRAVAAFAVAGMRALLDRRGSIVLLQNEDDRRLVIEAGIVSPLRTRVIRGSGVDLEVFAWSPLPVENLVLLPARMLADKGIREFIAAARLLRAQGVGARFVLVGGLDPANPSAISRRELERVVDDGVVEWWDHRDDMPDVLRAATVVCLPSYREGLPKALLEAAATGRPIVTTDAPGCRDVVTNEWNGLLVPVGDVTELAGALRRLLTDRSLCEIMGKRGRERVESEFDRRLVAHATLALYEEAFP